MNKLYPNNFYHIYNRGNNGENIFYKPDNYDYFLRKFDFYLSKYLEVYAFCLMPNHFYFLVRVKDFANLEAVPSIEGMASLIAEQFRKLFIGHAMAINRQEKRRGNLFQRPFKRKLIDDPGYLFRLVRYIHSNPVHHDFVDNIESWAYSSYLKILDPMKSKLKKKEVLDFFSGREKYIEQHKQKEDLDLIERFVIE